MARVDANIPDQLNKDFRKAVMDVYGSKKGNVSMAMVEALKDWINKVGRRKRNDKI